MLGVQDRKQPSQFGELGSPHLVRSVQELQMQRILNEKSAKSNRLRSWLQALTRAAVLTTTLLFSSPSAQATGAPVTPKKSIRERVELVRHTLKQKVADEKITGSQLSFSERSLTQQWNKWGNWGNWNNWVNWNNWNNWRNWGNWGNWGNF